MKLDQVANSGNDEFYTPDYAIHPLLKYIPVDWKVWCPFDQISSNIAKLIQARGNPIRYSHLVDGYDFFKTKPPEGCDCIISNPPYSKKTEVFERLFSLGIPFAMLVGVVGLFESQRRFEMFAKNSFEIMWLSKRISYLRAPGDIRATLNPPFSSVWLTSNILPQANIFEPVSK